MGTLGVVFEAGGRTEGSGAGAVVNGGLLPPLLTGGRQLVPGLFCGGRGAGAMLPPGRMGGRIGAGFIHVGGFHPQPEPIQFPGQ